MKCEINGFGDPDELLTFLQFLFKLWITPSLVIKIYTVTKEAKATNPGDESNWLQHGHLWESNMAERKVHSLVCRFLLERSSLV